MSNDLTGSVGLSRCSKVRLLGICESTSLEILNSKLDLESCIGLDGIEVGRVLELYTGSRGSESNPRDPKKSSGVLALQLGILS